MMGNKLPLSPLLEQLEEVDGIHLEFLGKKAEVLRGLIFLRLLLAAHTHTHRGRGLEGDRRDRRDRERIDG